MELHGSPGRLKRPSFKATPLAAAEACSKVHNLVNTETKRESHACFGGAGSRSSVFRRRGTMSECS